jgi:hypothetical protein
VNHSDTDEARAKRRERRALQKAQGIDLLAEREHNIKFWKKCAQTNRQYTPHNGAWWHVFTWNLAFRHLLLPQLRARQDVKDKAWKQKCAEDSRAYSLKCAAAKVQRLADKRATTQPAIGQTMELFA